MLNKVFSTSLRILTQSCKFQFARVKFPLPDLGQKIKQGTVKKLYVSEGDRVQQFQKIADVQSDKQFTEITAPQIGFISKIYYKESEVCKVGDLFMQFDTDIKDGEVVSNKNEPKQVKKEQSKVKSNNVSLTDNDSVFASPTAKMHAKFNNIDLSKVKGTGKRGIILKQDLTNFMQGKQVQSKASIKQQKTLQTQEISMKSYESKTIKMNAFQKGMQKSMTQANKVPHLYYDQKMDVTELDQMREKLKKSGVKVTVMGILIKTISLALIENPKINSLYRGEKDQFSYQIQEAHNISLAIDTANGLVVPNIKNVQGLSIADIQQKLTELKKLSDSARLTRNHLEGGTICLSNIGTIAGTSACPLVLCPQTSIVAIGRVVEAPFYFGSQIVKRKYITMSFGCDHRVIDGGSIARFSNSWKNILQNPYLALVKMR